MCKHQNSNSKFHKNKYCKWCAAEGLQKKPQFITRIHPDYQSLKSTCHPDSEYCAKGLCKKCYHSKYHKKRWGFQDKKENLTICHPDQKYWAKGLCKNCYMKMQYQLNKIKQQENILNA